MSRYYPETKAVLFTSSRPYSRAENITAVYDAYDGPKEFVQVSPWAPQKAIASKTFALRVTDEFITSSPGRAVMIGHGIAGGKTYGLDQPHPYHRAESGKLLTYVITTSARMRSLVARQSGVSEDAVLPLGMPRTDAYIGKKKGDGRTALAGFRSYLYVPTYRAKEETPMPLVDWHLIDSLLEDGELLAVKPHMVTGTILPPGRYNHISELPTNEPSARFLYDCDVVITDYSSIMFDAYLLKKPVVLFEKCAGYLQTRGMYLDYPYGYSSRYCTDEESLIRTIRKADALGKTEKDVIELVAGACDGHSSKRVCDLIRRIIHEGSDSCPNL